MARVRFPFHSIAASGSIGGVLTARPSPYGTVMRKKPKSRACGTYAQLIEQDKMRAASTAYRALSALDRALWQYLGEKRNLTAWVAFWCEYQAQNTQAPDAPLIPSTWV